MHDELNGIHTALIMSVHRRAERIYLIAKRGREGGREGGTTAARQTNRFDSSLGCMFCCSACSAVLCGMCGMCGMCGLCGMCGMCFLLVLRILFVLLVLHVVLALRVLQVLHLCTAVVYEWTDDSKQFTVSKLVLCVVQLSNQT